MFQFAEIANFGFSDPLDVDGFGEAPTVTFSDVTNTAGVGELGLSRVAHFVDLDDDGWLDLLVVNDDDGLAGALPSRIFRNNAVLSAEGVPQLAAIMGNCVAGGGYLPVLCDTLLMTEGSGLYLAGPALVKAAIGQEVENEARFEFSNHASICPHLRATMLAPTKSHVAHPLRRVMTYVLPKRG